MSLESLLRVRPTILHVDLDAVQHNVRTLSRAAGGTPVLAVVKANAYGCGVLPVTRAVLDGGADWLGVAVVSEGIQLRLAGIEAPILLLGPAGVEQCGDIIDSDLTAAVFGVRFLRALQGAARLRDVTVRAHLKVDSGMGRLGARPEELPDLLEAWSKAPNVRLEGVFSNLASADAPQSPQNSLQVERFRDMVKTIRQSGFRPRWLHLANTATLLTREDAHLELVRPGLSLYGMRPSDQVPDPGLRQALTLQTRLVQLKEVPSGIPIGYGGAFVTRAPTRIGILPLGYGDGLPRGLSGEGYVLFHGRRCPIAGRVSMDLTAVDLGPEGPGAEGDAVTLWGEEGGESLSPLDWARWMDTIPYEVISGISARVARCYLRKGETLIGWPLDADPDASRRICAKRSSRSPLLGC